MKRQPILLARLLDIPLFDSFDGEHGGLEEIARDLNIKHAPTIKQERLA